MTRERGLVLPGEEDPTADSGLALLTAMPGARVAAEHYHPALHERFHVVAGRLSARIDGRDLVLGPGEEASVAPGVVHDWWNAGAEPAGVVVEIGPPRAAGERFALITQTLFGLANAGRTNAKGMPHPLQLPVIARELDDVILVTKPPETIQRLVVGPLAAISLA